MKYLIVVLILTFCVFVTLLNASPAKPGCKTTCTRELDPVCAYDGETYRIFSNPCAVNNEVCATGRSWAEARMADCLQRADKPENCLVPCTKEYIPVCATNGKDLRLFPNKCEVKNGRCEDGTNWYQTRMSDCDAAGITDEADETCEVPCTREYSPVCGTDGVQVKLFSNICLLRNERCKRGRNWHEIKMIQCTILPFADSDAEICEKPCTREYNLVCGTNGAETKLFPNPCILQNEHCSDEKEWRQTRMEECTNNFEDGLKCPVFCTREYIPVCGYNGKEYQLFPNQCLLKVQMCNDGENWVRSEIRNCILPESFEDNRFKRDVVCEMPCTRELNPVCGFDGEGSYKIFNNPCILRNEHCTDGHNWIQTKMSDCETNAS